MLCYVCCLTILFGSAILILFKAIARILYMNYEYVPCIFTTKNAWLAACEKKRSVFFFALCSSINMLKWKMVMVDLEIRLVFFLLTSGTTTVSKFILKKKNEGEVINLIKLLIMTIEYQENFINLRLATC